MTLRAWDKFDLFFLWLRKAFFQSVSTQSAVLSFSIKLSMTKKFGHLCCSNFLNSGRYFAWVVPASCWQVIWLEVYCSFCAAASASLAWPVSVNLARDFSCTPGISICMSGWIYIAVYVSDWLCQVCLTGEPLHFLFCGGKKKNMQGTSRHPPQCNQKFPWLLPVHLHARFEHSVMRTEIIMFLSWLTANIFPEAAYLMLSIWARDGLL